MVSLIINKHALKLTIETFTSYRNTLPFKIYFEGLLSQLNADPSNVQL